MPTCRLCCRSPELNTLRVRPWDGYFSLPTGGGGVGNSLHRENRNGRMSKSWLPGELSLKVEDQEGILHALWQDMRFKCRSQSTGLDKCGHQNQLKSQWLPNTCAFPTPSEEGTTSKRRDGVVGKMEVWREGDVGEGVSQWTWCCCRGSKKSLTGNYFIRKLISSIITFLSRSLTLPLSLCLSLFISPHSTQSIQSSKFESLEEIINGFWTNQT